ncbi:MAG: hypothetical protein RR738_10580 [Anaerorhabdus sp.]
MIAVTSNFGGGKSSVVESLSRKINGKNDSNFKRKYTKGKNELTK